MQRSFFVQLTVQQSNDRIVNISGNRFYYEEKI